MPRKAKDTEAVTAAIETLGGMVQVARALLQGGRSIDLEGLDRDAAALCAALMTLERDAARGLRPALEALLRQIDSLTVEVART